MKQFLRKLGTAVSSLFAEESRLFFGGMEVPDTYGEGGFMLVGTIGSGKTVVLDMLIQQTVTKVLDPNRSDRALIYDPKREYVSKLQQLGLYDPVSAGERGSGFNAQRHRKCVVITNPLDERAFAWNIAEDFDHVLDGEQLAEIFTTGTNRYDRTDFFEKTSKQLFAAVFKALHRRKRGRWTLRDFILAFDSSDDTEALLSQHDDTRRVWQAYLGAEISRTDTGPSVHASLRTYLADMSAVAAAWHTIQERHPERTFSFRRWVNRQHEKQSHEASSPGLLEYDPAIILLGKSPRHGEHLQLVNRLMFHKASIELLGHPEQKNPRRNTWVFLDELPELGYLTKLQNLMAVGRSWGVRVVFAFQDYSQVVKTFGPEDAKTITNLSHTFGALNCSGETSEWLARLFGTYHDQQGNPKPRVPAEEFHRLPLDPQKKGVVGWYYSKRLDEMQAQRHPIPWSEVESVLLRNDPERDERDRKHESDYDLQLWDVSERHELFALAGTASGGLPSFGPWPVENSGKQFENDEQKAHYPAMDCGERKLHKVVWNGRAVELYCTDEEFPTLSRNDNYLRLLWEDQQRQRFGNLRLASSQTDARVEQARQKASEDLKPRRVEWQGKVLEFMATDEDFAVWGSEENYLLDKWYKQEGWRLYQTQKLATAEPARPSPDDE